MNHFMVFFPRLESLLFSFMKDSNALLIAQYTMEIERSIVESFLSLFFSSQKNLHLIHVGIEFTQN